MARRRRVLLGMGALVFGSGALSVNAAFQNSVNTGSDMRVVTSGDATDLDVEPGLLFRPAGDDPSDPVDAGSADPNNANVKRIVDTDQDPLFTNSDSGTSPDDDTPAFSPSTYPIAGVDESPSGRIQANNDNMDLAVGVPLEDTGNVGTDTNGYIQVVNNTGQDYNIRINVTDWGADHASGNGPGDLVADQIYNIFEFWGPDTSGGVKQVSPDDWSGHPDAADSPLRVNSGNTEQIYIKYATDDSDSEVSTSDVDALRQAADGNSNPFSKSDDTVDLIDTLAVEAEQV